MRVPQERLPAVSSRRFEHVAAVHAPLLPLPSSCLSLIGVLPISDRKSSGRTLSPHGVGAACAATASRAPAAQRSRSTSRARRTSSSAPHQPRRSRRPGGNRPSHRHEAPQGTTTHSRRPSRGCGGAPSRGHRTISVSASGHWWREGGRETGLDLQAGAPRRADRFLRGQLGLVHRRRVLRQYRRVHQVPLPQLRWMIDPLVAPPPRFRLSLHAPIVVLGEPRRTVARNVEPEMAGQNTDLPGGSLIHLGRHGSPPPSVQGQLA